MERTADPAVTDERVVGAALEPGELHVPVGAHAVVVIAGPDTKPERARLLVQALHEAKIGTYSLALGAPGESGVPSVAALLGLAQKVVAAGDWVSSQPEAAGLPLGVFGSDVAGGAALAAAALRPRMFRAVVSRTGHPELAGSTLDQVHAATLLIAAGHDDPSIATHQEAMARVRGIAELELISSASDTLDEPNATAQVARLTRRWFSRFLS